MTKQCEVCGRTISSDDWYSFIRTKYCRACAENVRRLKEAERMRNLRKQRREANALARELCKSQQQEIELLRAELLRQRERVDALLRKEADDDR